MKVSKATVSRMAKQAMKSKKIIKVGREYFLAEGAKNDAKPLRSFHARFTEHRLVSHFTNIGGKRETNAYFVSALSLKEALKTMKRDH